MADHSDNKQPFMDHVDELLMRLRRCFIYLIVGFGIGYTFSDYFIYLVKSPLNNIPFLPEGMSPPKIIVTAPFEKFWVYLRLAMVGGAFISVPLIGREVALFVGPGLKPHEKRRIGILVGSLYLGIMLGLFIGYKWVLPLVLSAIVRFGYDADIVNTWSLSLYVNGSLGILLVTALLIQLPLVMTHLSSWGWVRASTWGKSRRHAIVINAVVSGILSPPDVQSMIVMMIPVQLLYEAGILFARVAEWLSNDSSKEK